MCVKCTGCLKKKKMETISVTTAIKRLEKDWSIIAKEPVKVEVINDVFYGFCSELGS